MVLVPVRQEMWWHFKVLHPSLDGQAELALTIDERVVEESTLVFTTEAPAKAVQVQLSLKGSHTVGSKVLWHDLLHKFIRVMDGEASATRAEGNDMVVAVFGCFMQDAVQLERERLVLANLLRVLLSVEAEELIVLEIRTKKLIIRAVMVIRANAQKIGGRRVCDMSLEATQRGCERHLGQPMSAFHLPQRGPALWCGSA